MNLKKIFSVAVLVLVAAVWEASASGRCRGHGHNHFGGHGHGHGHGQGIIGSIPHVDYYGPLTDYWPRQRTVIWDNPMPVRYHCSDCYHRVHHATPYLCSEPVHTIEHIRPQPPQVINDNRVIVNLHQRPIHRNVVRVERPGLVIRIEHHHSHHNHSSSP